MVNSRANAPGWLFQDELTHGQINVIDLGQSRAIDKTNETTASGGGVSGEVDWKSGSSIVLQSGSSLTASANASATLDGYLYIQVRTVTSTYTVDSSGSDIVILLNPGASFTVTLPSIASGRTLLFKDISGAMSTNSVTLAPAIGSTQIDGVAGNRILYGNYGHWKLVCDGTNWWIL